MNPKVGWTLYIDLLYLKKRGIFHYRKVLDVDFLNLPSPVHTWRAFNCACNLGLSAAGTRDTCGREEKEMVGETSEVEARSSISKLTFTPHV